MTNTAKSIMQRLKAETNDLHSDAESRPLQRAIATGEVDRSAFTSYLGQLYHVHRASGPENNSADVVAVLTVCSDVHVW